MVKPLDLGKMFSDAVLACHLLVAENSGESGAAAEISAKLGGVLMKGKTIESGEHGEPAGVAAAVGSLRRAEYKDGAVFIYKVAEISDLSHRVAFELIEANPSIQVSGILHTLKLVEITETRETLIIWESDFSGDCNYNFFQDQKWKKLDAFKSLRAALL